MKEVKIETTLQVYDSISNLPEDVQQLMNSAIEARKHAYSPYSKFDVGAAILLDNGKVISFNEKPEENDGLINGGFFVFEPAIFDYILGDETSLEREPLERLAKDDELMAYEHKGFWQMMDTVLEKQLLEKLWKSGNPPWRRK